MWNASFFIFCKQDIKLSTSLEEANHRDFFPNLSIHNCGLSEAVIEHLIKSSKSSKAFFNSAWRPDGHLIERLLDRSDHSDEERLRLLVSWFDSSIRRQPREALGQVVCRLIKGINCSSFSGTFFEPGYSQRVSECVRKFCKENERHATTLIHKYLYIYCWIGLELTVVNVEKDPSRRHTVTSTPSGMR